MHIEERINKLEIRIVRTIKWFENHWINYNENFLSMDQIAIACALDYTIFRFNDKWKMDNPKLRKWFDDFVFEAVVMLNVSVTVCPSQ